MYAEVYPSMNNDFICEKKGKHIGFILKKSMNLELQSIYKIKLGMFT